MASGLISGNFLHTRFYLGIVELLARTKPVHKKVRRHWLYRFAQGTALTIGFAGFQILIVLQIQIAREAKLNSNWTLVPIVAALLHALIRGKKIRENWGGPDFSRRDF